MAAFKKSFLVLALALLALAGTTGIANAQHPLLPGGLMTCTASAVPAQSRAEGIAELLGDIVMLCTVSTTAGLPPTIQANISATLNVNVTNNRDFGLGSEVTDAVVVVNEVTGSAPTVVSTLSGVANTPVPQYGQRLPPATIQWTGTILPVPGVGGPSPLTIRITNMRGNVSQLGIIDATGAFPTAQVTAFVSIASQTAIPVTNNVLNIAVPLRGLDVRVRGPRQADVTLPIVALQCLSQNINSSGNIVLVRDTSVSPNLEVGSFTVRLSEGFASAFKTLGVPTVTPAVAQVEDGFPTPPSGVNGGGATQGTRFLIRFFNVPDGVRLATPAVLYGTPVSSSSGDTQPVSLPSSHPAHVLTLFKVLGVDVTGSGTLSADPATEITVTNRTAFVVYEVVDCNPFVVENVVVPVTVGFTANQANDLPGVGTLQVSASFAPTSTVTTASGSAPEPRFVDTGSPRAVYSIARCATTLLYPFVTNQAGFDTGFSIANTTRDPFGTAAQAGTCTLNYYGSTTGGGAAPAAQTTAVVASGSHIVWTLSGGNAAVNITGTPGFQGYLIAVCQFQFAHGFAFITDGFGGVPAIAEGYLALIIPNPSAFAATGGRQPSANIFIGTGESLAH